MIENVLAADQLTALARRKKRPVELRTVANSSVSEYLTDGWEIHRKNKTTSRMLRLKRRAVYLEDRVWSMLYAMGFTRLSGDGGALLSVDPKSNKGPTNQIDVVGLDPEIAIAIECKSASKPRKDPNFQKDLAKHNIMRQRFANAVNGQFPQKHKRVPVLAIFTSGVLVSDNDVERAKEQKVALLNENDLQYYEQLVAHLGPAAKYQFFADMLPGKQIYGLGLTIPALESKMGKHTCYSFSITPAYLLKIAYVSHRAKGKATDVDTYQRMIKKSRLKTIREYITSNGIFPTNIVVSLEGRRAARFEAREQQGGPEGARYGTLHLKPAYRSAWIIDGQHRLFAYSGHERATTSHLSVLAFVNLPASQQAQLFVDHYCPVRSRIESAGWGYRVSCDGSRMAARPVKWTFSRIR